MAKRASTLPSPTFSISHAAGTALHRQLYSAIRRAILSGQLRAGARLPSSRQLAAELAISRSTVVNAYDQLLAEGYLEGRVGAGTRVVHTLPDDLVRAAPWTTLAPAPPRGERRLSTLARRIGAPLIGWAQQSDRLRAFQGGMPALDAFPIQLWTQLLERHLRHVPAALLAGGSTAGYPPLREAIADYLRTARGVRCEAGQVIVTAGAQQALDLAARLLTDPGDRVLVEDPGYLGARGAFVAAGAKLVPLPVDNDGLDVSACEREGKAARLLYVCPSHQYPLGVTMSLSRRLALLDWASRNSVWIIEDDYDSEYRYSSRPLAALQGLDRAGRVIYMGTFTKVMFPSLRLGYLVAPPDLVDTFIAARALSDRHSALLDQAALADFIVEGHFARHLRRMRSLYAERQGILVQAAERELAGLLEVAPADAGMHLLGWLPAGVDDAAVARLAAQRGITTVALSSDSLRPLPRGALVLGYAGIDEWKIRAGVKELAAVLRDYNGKNKPTNLCLAEHRVGWFAEEEEERRK